MVTRLRGQQLAWNAMRRLRRFTLPELVRATKQRPVILNRLLRRGKLHRVEETRAPAASHAPRRHSPIYELVDDCGLEAPRLNDALCRREQVWRTMRLLTTFTPQELAIAASTDRFPVTGAYAAACCQVLREAAYLIMVTPRGRYRQARYRLPPQNDTGPLPPILHRYRYLFDPNLGRIVHIAAERHARRKHRLPPNERDLLLAELRPVYKMIGA